jgi:hypothetical protein
MSIHKRWRFTDVMVKDAPDCAGVYVLWRDQEPLAVGAAGGRADTVQSRLLSHLGLEDITHYSWEITRAPKARAAQIERELGLAGGREPESQPGT